MSRKLELHIVLVNPEIPQNTGNIGRVCVNTDSSLHLIEPLGFSLDESHVRRAGLDYWQYLRLHVYPDWRAFLDRFAPDPERMFFLSTRGRRTLYDCRFCGGDVLVFGNESRGLPPEFYETYRDRLFRIPMPGEHARSLNLANAVAITVFEALRQIRYSGPPRPAAPMKGGGSGEAGSRAHFRRAHGEVRTAEREQENRA